MKIKGSMFSYKFEDRLHNPAEIQKKFGIKHKTWEAMLGYHDKSSQKKLKTKKIRKQNLASIGVFKMPGTNYYVVEPNQFQDWFNEWVKSQ
tara:strand:+ start:184 stop:456 length:273 start_codon:yes stop_codon:yes gene_type:complete